MFEDLASRISLGMIFIAAGITWVLNSLAYISVPEVGGTFCILLGVWFVVLSGLQTMWQGEWYMYSSKTMFLIGVILTIAGYFWLLVAFLVFLPLVFVSIGSFVFLLLLRLFSGTVTTKGDLVDLETGKTYKTAGKTIENSSEVYTLVSSDGTRLSLPAYHIHSFQNMRYLLPRWVAELIKVAEQLERYQRDYVNGETQNATVLSISRRTKLFAQGKLEKIEEKLRNIEEKIVALDSANKTNSIHHSEYLKEFRSLKKTHQLQKELFRISNANLAKISDLLRWLGEDVVKKEVEKIEDDAFKYNFEL
jgi:hypothetical protein